MTPADVRELRSAVGGRAYEVSVGGRARRDDEDAERDWIRAVREAGATWWQEWIPPDDRDTMRAAVDCGPLRID